MTNSLFHPLQSLLVWPGSDEQLKYLSVGDGAGFLCPSTGVLFPVIDGIVVTSPVTNDAVSLCLSFLERYGECFHSADSRFDLAKTKSALSVGASAPSDSWHHEEMSHWEPRFEKQLVAKRKSTTGWNRTLPRKKLLDRLPEPICIKVVLEIGCGGASTLCDVCEEGIEAYIGLDLSLNACRLARRLFPSGLIIQGSVEAVPLRAEAIDCIVAYGVLHHLPSHERQVAGLLPLLKRGGFFIGSDPILKPRIPRPKFLRAGHTKPDLSTSPHNEWIDWDNLLRSIQNEARPVDFLFEYGPLRSLLIPLFYDRMGMCSKGFTQMLILMDRLWLSTLGRLHRALGPGGIIYTLQRKPSDELETLE